MLLCSLTHVAAALQQLKQNTTTTVIYGRYSWTNRQEKILSLSSRFVEKNQSLTYFTISLWLPFTGLIHLL